MLEIQYVHGQLSKRHAHYSSLLLLCLLSTEDREELVAAGQKNPTLSDTFQLKVASYVSRRQEWGLKSC